MIVTMIPYCPGEAGGLDLGRAYNDQMSRLQDGDWACFIDHDACFTTTDWYPQLERIIKGRDDELCVLTAVTNRIGCPWQQRTDVDPGEHSMQYHRRVGRAVKEQFSNEVLDVTEKQPLSGVLILLSKRTWKAVGGFAAGFLGVDNSIHNAVQQQGGHVYLMHGVYVYHWYRAQELPWHPPIMSTKDLKRTAQVANTNVGSQVENAETKSDELLDFFRVVSERTLRLNGENGSQQICELLSWDSDQAVPRSMFDCVILDRLLGQLPTPVLMLSKLRSHIAPHGCLLARVSNVAHQSVINALLSGRWTNMKPDRQLKEPIPGSTRREIEKLFYRAGYVAEIANSDVQDDLDRDDQLPASDPLTSVSPGSKPSGDALPDHHTREFAIRALPTAEEPASFGLTSIVIVTFNQLEYTIQCIDSIIQFTDEPYELVVVDNASTDGTGLYLDEISEKVSHGPVRVIRNAENRGFPSAANQGIAVASGTQVLLLNNDVIVTTGWLRRQLVALYSAPEVGLVGPCSNNVSGTQQVPVAYTSLTSLDGFAWEWGKANHRRIEAVDRLVGFCLLFRREVVDRVGLLDERFGIGNFEDDDFCRRAISCGYTAVIARDAFVHHFGSRTFVGTGIDLNELLARNQQNFMMPNGRTIKDLTV